MVDANAEEVIVHRSHNYFSDYRPLLFFSDKLAAAYTPNAAYLFL
jgi:hypothetical protein